MSSKREKESTFFLIQYRDPQDGKTVAIKAKKIEDSPLGLSFIRISHFLFDTESVVVKPVEEQLKERFKNVKSLHLSIYSVISIEELGMQHLGLKFRNDKSNLIAFPKDLQ